VAHTDSPVSWPFPKSGNKILRIDHWSLIITFYLLHWLTEFIHVHKHLFDVDAYNVYHYRPVLGRFQFTQYLCLFYVCFSKLPYFIVIAIDILELKALIDWLIARIGENHENIYIYFGIKKTENHIKVDGEPSIILLPPLKMFVTLTFEPMTL